MSIKKRERTIGNTRGKVIFRRDMSLMKMINRKTDTTILTNRLCSLLSPWSHRMLDAIGIVRNIPFNERMSLRKNKEISQNDFVRVFHLSHAWERIKDTKNKLYNKRCL